MPNKDGSGPEGQGQCRRTTGCRQGQRAGRDRAKRRSGGRRSGGGTGSGRRQAPGKKWQHNENH